MNTTDVTEVWGQALALLSNINETKSDLAKVWLGYLVPVSYDSHQIVFAVKLLQAKNWIEERYLPYIIEAVASVLGSHREVVLVIDETLGQSVLPLNPASHVGAVGAVGSAVGSAVGAAGAANTVSSPAMPGSLGMAGSSPMPAGVASSAPPILSAPAAPAAPAGAGASGSTSSFPAVGAVAMDNPNPGSGLSSMFAPDAQIQSASSVEPHSRFNFSNYVMGESNVFAYRASLRVAEAPGLYYNPLFIFGKSGLGKTHLLLSIKNYINTYLLDRRVVYAPITEFINDFTNALAEDRSLTGFKRKYHTCDVLLIDDVQNLEGKEGTTNALFEIFNIFIENKKQIVLSADRSPVEINIDERFASRFAQGITADIQPPNYEMKTAILKNYKRYYCNFLSIPEVSFSDEAIQRIVELSGSNIRELEGAVSNLIVYVSCRPSDSPIASITYNDVENVLGSSFFHKSSRRIDFNMVFRAVESYFQISRAELLSEKRSKNISHPRHIAMYLIRHHTEMSYPEIGDIFNKDHTSVIYADRITQKKMVEEASVKVEVEKINEILTS